MQPWRVPKENQPTICTRDSERLAGGGELPEAVDIGNSGIKVREMRIGEVGGKVR